MMFSNLHLKLLRSTNHRAAFSLVEMSVVVLIISIVAVAGLELTAGFFDRTAYQVTQARLSAIDQAMVEFRRVNNRLPCPARHANIEGDSCYGKEYNSTVAGACNNNTGSCAAGTLNSGTLFYGHVPVRDLGLPLSAGLDGYGNRIWYVVTLRQVYTAAVSPTNYFANTADGIAVRSGKVDATCGGASDLCQSRGNASYFLFSTGRDQRGGLAPQSSTAQNACFRTVADDDGKIDTINCRLGLTTTTMKNGSTAVTVPANAFYDSRYNAGTQESTYFDDIVRWRSKNQL